MTVKTGYAEGECPDCGHVYKRPRPEDLIICPCYEFCPNCSPAFTVKMNPYTPDMTPSTYGPIISESAMGDTEHPMNVLFRCPVCGYYSATLPQEVKLT